MHLGYQILLFLLWEYKCAVTETDIPSHMKEGPVNIPRLMRIRLLKRYPPDQFTFDILGRDYGIFAVRGPRGIPAGLSAALNDAGKAADHSPNGR